MSLFDRNIPYNNLPPLPPEKEWYYDEAIACKLTETSRALAELKGLASSLPNQSIFVNSISLREAKASSAIENIFTTDDELYKALSFDDNILEGPAKEILHYREALWLGYSRIREKSSIDVQTIIEIFNVIKQNRESIRPYQSETVIMKRGLLSLKGEVVYTPPRGKGVVEKKLSDLMEFINDDEKYPVDPLLKMILAHYQFEAIHPFRDGNGRTGRILCILIMILKNLLDLPILYLSAHIINTKEDYYYNLSSCTGSMNWKPWVSYMLDAVRNTAEYTMEKVIRIKKLIERTSNIFSNTEKSLQKIDIDKFFQQPYIRPKNLISDKIKSLNTAKKYMAMVEALGLVSKCTIGNEIVYINSELLEILSD